MIAKNPEKLNMEPLSIPLPLREIHDPPKRLYLRGSLPSFETYTFLSVVGSRRYSPYGRDACEKIIAGLRGYPIVIVSGLAIGMDAIALQAGMNNGLPVVAIPGSGISDKAIYPRSNVTLAHDILNHGGGLLSEFPPDFLATMWSFPQRNRLMAGISKAVLVIEAEEKSGTRITAKLAVEYNREVLAVPGSIFSSTSEGTNMLIKEGATPVTSALDVLRALGFEETEKSPAILFSDCSPEEQKVLALLRSPMSRSDLIRALELSTSAATILLSAMEIKGMIRESLGEVRRA